MSISINGKTATNPLTAGWDNYQRVLILFLLLIQSIGIRFFGGQGIFLSITILVLASNGLVRFTGKDFLFMLSPILFFCFSKIINPQFQTSALIFQSLLVICAYVVLKNYKDISLLRDDFYSALQVIAVHALFGYLLFVAVPGGFQNTNYSGMGYRAFFNMFFIAFDSDGGGGFRNCGFCWEPGLLQLVLNMLLFLSIQRKASYIQQFLIVLAIISTFSTAGYIILSLNFLYFLIQNRKTKNGWIFISISLVFLFLFSALFMKNITDKLGESSTSGLIRSRDFRVGLELVKQKPITGHGKFTSTYLISQPFFADIEADIFTKEYLDMNGEMSGGFTNGFMGLFAWFGVPFGLLALIMLFRTNVIKAVFYERLIFTMIVSLTLVSEPITDTSLFFLLAFSTISFSRKEEKKTTVEHTENPLLLEAV